MVLKGWIWLLGTRDPELWPGLPLPPLLCAFGQWHSLSGLHDPSA